MASLCFAFTFLIPRDFEKFFICLISLMNGISYELVSQKESLKLCFIRKRYLQVTWLLSRGTLQAYSIISGLQVKSPPLGWISKTVYSCTRKLPSLHLVESWVQKALGSFLTLGPQNSGLDLSKSSSCKRSLWINSQMRWPFYLNRS